LLCPVITEAKKATAALGWAVKEMESRYKLMTSVGVKNIDGYNSKHKKHMPYNIEIVDEMADLMLIAGKEIENYIQRILELARQGFRSIEFKTLTSIGLSNKLTTFDL